MGMLVKFPEGGSTRHGRYVGGDTESAIVLILPVVRVERHDDEPGDGEPDTAAATSTQRRRRRRAAR